MTSALLFTRSNKLGSRFICWLLQEPMSHVALRLSNGLVVHATMTQGLVIGWSSQFAQQNTILGGIILDFGNSEMSVLSRLLDKYYGRGYDWPSVVYLGWRGLLRRLAGIPFPSTNPLNRQYLMFCSEWAELVLGRKQDAMLTPYALYKQLVATIPQESI